MKKTLSLALIAIFGVTVLASCNKKADATDMDGADMTLGEELKAIGDTTDAMFIDVKSDSVIQGADSVSQIITQVVATPE